MGKFAEVILPLPLYSTFTYSVPTHLEGVVETGTRVFVQFGKKKFYTGIVASVSDRAPEGYEVKEIMMALDSHPILRYPQLKFWQWIAEYYLCSVGEVYKAALPAGLKIESETFVTLNADYEFDGSEELTDRQIQIVQTLDHDGRLRISDIEKQTGVKNCGAVVNVLLERGIVEIDEKVVERYKPKKQTFVRLKAERSDSDRLHDFFDKVARSPKQEKLLIGYLEMSKWLQTQSDVKEVLKSELTEKMLSSPAILKALVDKEIMEVYTKEVNRFNKVTDPRPPELASLSDTQLTAWREIKDSFSNHAVTLLRGVTGSGKTEIYSHLMNAVLNHGDQVLYLVPEISLTTQLTDRLRRMFGDRLLVYHSKFSDNERVDIWNKLLATHEPLIVLGVRSSVFLPFSRLGLVIVDEEHESSYKQYDPAPRYNARDAAIVLATMHGAKTLLGSATPSVETYYKALEGKYGLVELKDRYAGAVLPDVEIVDMKMQRKKHLNKGVLSSPLRKATHEALSNGNQVLMFQNRRGFAPMVQCGECGWTPKCVNCDVSLVYHKNTRQLRCHYCGYSIALPTLCPACGLNGINTFGYGTERIAEEVHNEYSDYKVARMDLDTTRNKDAYQDIIEKFAAHQTDLLVGTQMISKGLDFAKVKVVGVINADTLLNFPDFRSEERAFNMLEQVSGRAGRKGEKGKVIIQTTNPDEKVLAYVKAHDYDSYYAAQIEDRRRYAYPPFTKVINIYLKHRDSSTVDMMAVAYSNALRQTFGNRVLGPEKPAVGRVATFYLQTIMLKIEANASMKKVKSLLRIIYEKMAAEPRMKGVVVYYDVDPV